MVLDFHDLSKQGPCAFCEASNGDAPLVVDLHRIISRENKFIVVGMRCETYYNSMTIEVPRCRRCQRSHRCFALMWQIPNVAILILAFAFTIALLCQYWNAGDLSFALIFGVVACVTIGALLLLAAVGLLLASLELVADCLGFNTERRARSVEPLKSLLAAGWAIGTEPPYKGDDIVSDNATN